LMLNKASMDAISAGRIRDGVDGLVEAIEQFKSIRAKYLLY